MKEKIAFLQTYEIFLKLIYLKLLQEYLNNEIIGFTDKVGGEETSYYTVTDIQGSITEVYDGSSNLVWKSGYTAFGELAGETVDLIDFDGMYTGCDYDADTGLTYHWNRWRSEDGSVFISEDPARDGANWYGYAGQNPMVYTDPTGLAPYINGVYDGPYNPDYNPGVPVEGPKTNPNGMPQNQTPNITGQVAEEKCVESPNVKDTSAIINSIEPQEERNIELLWGAYRINNDKVEIILGFKIRGKEKEVTASLKKQAELEKKFGYDNILCYVTSGLNMYISDGVVTERFIDTNLEKIIENNLDAENRIKDFNNYSMDLAKALGLEKYYSYIYPESNGFNQLFLSKEKFYQSKYKYGIGNYLKKGHAMNLNKNSKINNFDHYMLFRNTPFNDFWNPGVDNGEGNYILYNISPVESYSVR